MTDCQFMFYDGRVCGNPITREFKVDSETARTVLWLREKTEWYLCKGHYLRIKKHLKKTLEQMAA